jgi:large subunit ribosomal protein L45
MQTDRYRWARAKKVAKIELPDFEKMREDTTKIDPDQMRSMMKEQGIVPPRMWDERPVVFTCSGDIIDPYLPDAPAKSIGKKMKDTAMRVYTRPISKIVRFLPDFDQNNFAENEAVTIYRRAHELLAQMGTQEDIRLNEEDLLQYVTEKCYPEMLFRVDRKTIHWKWLGHLEKPKFIQAKIIDGPDMVSHLLLVNVV